MFDSGPKNVREYFKNEELILTQLNPFLFALVIPLYLDLLPGHLLSEESASKDSLAHIFNIALYMILIFEDDLKSGIQGKLYSLLMRILKFAESNIETCTKNGTMMRLLNNALFARMIKDIDYEASTNSYNS